MKIKPKRIQRVVIVIPRNPGWVHQFSLKEPMPSEGAILIATVIRKLLAEWQIREQGIVVIDESITPLGGEVDRKNPAWQYIAEADVIGISAMTPLEERGYWVIKRATEINPDASLIAGGIGPTTNPEKALENGVKLVVLGEGVDTIKEVMRVLRDGGEAEDIPGIAWTEDGKICKNPPRALIGDLDTVPFADWKLVFGWNKIQVRSISLSAGCPRRCTYCIVSEIYGHRYRHRSSSNAAEYIAWAGRGHRAVQRWSKSRPIFICDDDFAANERHTEGVLRELQRLRCYPSRHKDLAGTSLTVEMRAGHCKNSGLMELMKDEIDWALFGFEGVTQDALDSVKKRQTPEDIVHAVRTCHQHGVKVGGMFMVGLDPHTRESGVEIAKFALGHGIDILILFVRSPYPMTEDTLALERADRILPGIPTRYRDAQFAVMKHPNMSPKEWQLSHLRALRTYYSTTELARDVVKGRIGLEQSIYRAAGSTFYVNRFESLANRFITRYL